MRFVIRCRDSAECPLRGVQIVARRDELPQTAPGGRKHVILLVAVARVKISSLVARVRRNRVLLRKKTFAIELHVAAERSSVTFTGRFCLCEVSAATAVASACNPSSPVTPTGLSSSRFCTKSRASAK